MDRRPHRRARREGRILMRTPGIRGRRRIAHEVGKSERTISRWIKRGIIDVSYEEPEQNRVMVLPLVEEAKRRDWEARVRLAAGLGYEIGADELLERRAWSRCRGGRRG